MMKANILMNNEKRFTINEHNNVNCRLHLHTNMEIILVTKGRLNMSVDGRDYEILKGQGVFVPPFASHSFASPNDNTCQVIEFNQVLAPDFFEFLRQYSTKINLFSLSKELYNYVYALISEHKFNTVLEVKALLSPLCLQISNGCDFVAGGHIEEDIFLDAVDYINKHFSEDISLKSVAAAVGVHYITLSKRFSERADISFSAYVNYVRCINAAHLLKSSKQTISEVAFASGYNTIRNFNRAFLDVFCTTPSRFREA